MRSQPKTYSLPEMTSDEKLGVLALVFISVVFLFLVFQASGCTKTIVVPDGKPFQLAQDVPNVKIRAFDENGTLVEGGTATLHNGQWVVTHATPSLAPAAQPKGP